MTHPRSLLLRRVSIIALAALMVASFAFATPAQAQRRPAPEILPDDTLVYVRIPDIKDFMSKMQESALGLMMQDEEVAPFAEAMYGLAADEFAQLEEQVGLTLDEVMELPQGELCFALVATDDPDVPIAIVALLDVGDSIDLAQTLEESGSNFLFEEGVEQSEEEIGATTLKIINENDPEEMLVYFERDGTYGFSNNLDIVKDMLVRWNLKPQSRDKVFSNNRKFVTIMNRCRGTKDARPDMTFFVDPIGIFKAVSGGGAGGAVAMAFARSIGVTGLLGVGGSYILGVDDFDAISHMHIYLASPREGVMKMLAMKSGEIEPPSFVPAETVTYMTLNWDIPTTFEEFRELYNTVSQDEFALDDAIENNINENLGIDFEEDVLGNLTGRLVYMTYMVPPARINSQSTVVGLSIEDAEAAKETMELMFDQDNAPELEEDKVRGVTVYKLPGPRQARERAREARARARADRGDDEEEDEFEQMDRNIRMPEPCFCFLDDYLLISDSFEAMELAIESADGRVDELASDPDFIRIYEEVARQTGSERAGMITFTRPAAMLETFYELGVDPENQDRLRDAGEDEPFFGRLSDTLEDNPIPPFEAIAKYLTTAGGVMTADEAGFHYFSFGYRPELDE